MSPLGRGTLALVLVAGCASRAKESSAPRPERSQTFGLPPVREALVFPPETREVTLAWLVDELARLSGQELGIESDQRRQLEASVEPLELHGPVPADEAYAFVEALLWRQGFVLAPVTAGTRPVLGIYGGPERGGSPRSVPIEPEDVAALDGHPALLCQVVIPFENLDSRQLQTQLRQLMVDSGPHQQVVAVGERSLLIQAGGARLQGLVELLQAVDRASASRSSSTAAAAAPAVVTGDPDAKWPTRPRTQ